jgi:hypothetical protein|tara:strand:- start:59 stop:1327 length:1269 start_codon:yes stop_codon:yes gene_type:complete
MTYSKIFIKKNILSWLIFIFISSIIYFLFVKQLIYPTIIPMVRADAANIFSDWTVILQANLCYEKGYDVFVENPCDYWNRKHVYGEILLYLPGIKTVPKFYFLILPILINLLFIFSLVKLFTYNDNIKYFSIFVFIISPPVLLAIERANIDIIIFLSAVIISKNKNLLFNHIIVILTTITKFYPICLAIVFIFKKNIKKIITNLIIVFLFILIIMFFQFDSIIKIFDNQKQFSGYGYGVYNFSFIGTIKFINSLKIIFSNKDYTWIKYVYLCFVCIMPLILLSIFNFKKIYNISLKGEFFHENTFENKLYIISSTIILLCYLSFSNFIYREIFFLGLIPLLLKGEKYSNNKKFFSFYYYILSFKFLLTTLLIYISRNDNILPSFEPFIITLKYTLDFYIMLIITLIFLFYVKNFIRGTLLKL